MKVSSDWKQTTYRMRSATAVFTLLSVLLSCACSPSVAHAAAEADEWVSLGAATVHPRGDTDVIRVNPTVLASKIQLRVARAAVVFRSVKVTFADGTVQNVTLRHRIAAGGKTRVIDLNGGQRRIASISLSYRTPPKGKKFAVVSVFAKH